jgi:hypothetical protein
MSDMMTIWSENEPRYREQELERIAREGARAKPGAARKLALLISVCVACCVPALAVAASNGSLAAPVEPAWSEPDAPVAAPVAVPDAPSVAAVPVAAVAARGPEKAKEALRRAVRSCVDATTEIYGTGVRVCDVPRTANGKAGIWEPAATPARLAARDLPSPSGLLR